MRRAERTTGWRNAKRRTRRCSVRSDAAAAHRPAPRVRAGMRRVARGLRGCYCGADVPLAFRRASDRCCGGAAPRGQRLIAFGFDGGPIGAGPAAPIGAGPAAPIGAGPAAPQGAGPAAPMGAGPAAPMGAGPAAPIAARPAGASGAAAERHACTAPTGAPKAPAISSTEYPCASRCCTCAHPCVAAAGATAAASNKALRARPYHHVDRDVGMALLLSAANWRDYRSPVPMRQTATRQRGAPCANRPH